MRRIGLATVALLSIAALFLYSRRSDPPETPAARVTRATLIQLLTTNGKVEALNSFAIHVKAAVLVRDVLVREGDRARKGQLLATVDDTASREALARAQAQLEVARADSGRIERGGATAEIAEVDAAIARARLDKETAEREIASLQRLVERQAAPRADLDSQQEKLRRIEGDLKALERKRTSLVAPEDRQRVLARIREAEIAVSQAESDLRQVEIRSPAGGILYASSLRPGAFYNAGELLGQVGELEKVRVRVLVDEPEVGRVQAGQQVHITWDALPGESWRGVVERLPSQIEAAGTRSVGEVLCTMENPGRRLLPNVTVNVEIRTGQAENALTIPREAVVRDGENSFVFVADSAGVVARIPVKLGVQDPTRVQILAGLSEGQTVLLPGDRVLRPGEKVQPQKES